MSETKALNFRNRPLVRCGNDFYYGSMTDKHIISIKQLAFRKSGDVDIPTRVQIQLLYTDPDIKGKGKIVKSSEQDGMAVALDLAATWLDRYNQA